MIAKRVAAAPTVTPEHGTLIIRLTTPLPVRITGTAAPVVIKNALPIPVHVDNGPDKWTIIGLIVSVLALAATVGAVFFAWRSTVAAEKAAKLGQDAIDLAKQDLAINLEQATKSNEDRARRPELKLYSLDENEDGVTFVYTDNLPHKFTINIMLKNIGYQSATMMSASLEASPGMYFQGAEAGHQRTTFNINVDGLAVEAPVSIRDFPLVVGQYGLYTLFWTANSYEGSWPVVASAPLEKWGKIKIEVASNGTRVIKENLYASYAESLA